MVDAFGFRRLVGNGQSPTLRIHQESQEGMCLYYLCCFLTILSICVRTNEHS